jgi:hypothetical protein
MKTNLLSTVPTVWSELGHSLRWSLLYQEVLQNKASVLVLDISLCQLKMVLGLLRLPKKKNFPCKVIDRVGGETWQWGWLLMGIGKHSQASGCFWAAGIFVRLSEKSWHGQNIWASWQRFDCRYGKWNIIATWLQNTCWKETGERLFAVLMRHEKAKNCQRLRRPVKFNLHWCAWRAGAKDHCFKPSFAYYP